MIASASFAPLTGFECDNEFSEALLASISQELCIPCSFVDVPNSNHNYLSARSDHELWTNGLHKN